MIFRKWGGGGSKAVWNFSENSSVLDVSGIPKDGPYWIKWCTNFVSSNWVANYVLCIGSPNLIGHFQFIHHFTVEICLKPPLYIQMQNGFDYVIQSDSFISFDGWLMALNPVTIILDIIHWQKIRFVQLHMYTWRFTSLSEWFMVVFFSCPTSSIYIPSLGYCYVYFQRWIFFSGTGRTTRTDQSYLAYLAYLEIPWVMTVSQILRWFCDSQGLLSQLVKVTRSPMENPELRFKYD